MNMPRSDEPLTCLPRMGISACSGPPGAAVNVGVAAGRVGVGVVAAVGVGAGVGVAAAVGAGAAGDAVSSAGPFPAVCLSVSPGGPPAGDSVIVLAPKCLRLPVAAD